MKLHLIVAGLLAVGCKPTTVAKLREDLAKGQKLEVIDAGNLRIEIRKLTSAQRILAQSGLTDSDVISSSAWDSLQANSNPMGSTFVMIFSPGSEFQVGSSTGGILYGASQGEANYSKNLEFYQFGLAKRIWLETELGRVSLSQFHCENNFGASKSTTFIFSFPTLDYKPKAGTVSLVLDDVIPGLSRKKISWDITSGEYNENI